MIFETLYESSKRNELILIDGGFCHWHLCKQSKKQGQITIKEIISIRPGAGSEMLEILKTIKGATNLFAKCPVDLPSNNWYSKKGFELEAKETTKTGRELNLWRLKL